MALQDLRFNITAVDETGTAFRAAAEEAAAGSQAVAQAAGKAAAGQQEVALASAAVTRELIVLGREGLVGNFSRLIPSILALSERLQATGTSVLNLGTVFKIFGSIAGTMLNSTVLGIVGISVALELVPKLFGAMGSSVDGVNEVLKTHKAVLDQIKQAYGDAAIAAASYSGSASSALALRREAQLDIEAIGRQLTASLNSAAADIGRIRFFGNLSGEAGSFRQAILVGTADVGAFRTKLLEVADDPRVDEGLRHQADSLLAMTGAAQKLTFALAEAKAAEYTLAHTIPESAGIATSFSVAFDNSSLAKAKETLRSQLKAFEPPETASDKLADKQAKSADRVAASLQLQIDNLTRTSREQSIYNALAQAGVTATSTLGQKIAGLAGSYFDQNAALQKTIAKLDEFRTMARDALGTFFSDLEQGKSVITAFGDAVVGAMQHAIDDGLNAFVDAMFGAKGSPSLSSGGGFLTAIGHLFGFAEGGTMIAGGAGGPDSQVFAARVTPGERIDFTPPGQSKSVAPVININNDFTNADPSSAARLSFLAEQIKRQAVNESLAMLRQGIANNPRFLG